MPNYDIASMIIKIETSYESHFKALFEPYLTTSNANYEIIQTNVDLIKPILEDPVMKTDNRFFFNKDGMHILQVYHQSGQVKYQITHNASYTYQEILFVEGLNRTKADMVYILLSMAFMEIAILNGFLAIHASSLWIKDDVILFSAPSQTGKSTHVHYYLEQFKHMKNLNDDKPLIKDGYVYGTPFSGKNMQNINDKQKLKTIVFIHQGSITKIERLKEDKAIELILKNMLRPTTSDTWDKLLPSINQVLKYPLYEAYLKKDPNSIYITYQGIYEETIMQLKNGFTLKEIGSKTMVVPIGEKALNFNGVMTVNKTGKLLFEALAQPQTIESLKTLLMDHYDVTEDIALKDVITFIETLKEKDLL